MLATRGRAIVGLLIALLLIAVAVAVGAVAGPAHAAADRDILVPSFIDLGEAAPDSVEALLPLVRQLALALGYVHQQGFVHCDLKPENVRVMPDGSVKLMDFGMMEVAGQPAPGTYSMAMKGVPSGSWPKSRTAQTLGWRRRAIMRNSCLKRRRAASSTAPPVPSTLSATGVPSWAASRAR